MLNIYLISNINPNRHKYINKICQFLDDSYDVFKPHLDNKYNLDQSKIEYDVFLTDKEQMEKSDVCLILMPLFGRDCAAEIGFSKGIGKCVIAYVGEMEKDYQRNWLNDWMVKGFIDCYITTCEASYKLMMNNELIKKKQEYADYKLVIYLSSLDQLSKEIMEVYHAA